MNTKLLDVPYAIFPYTHWSESERWVEFCKSIGKQWLQKDKFTNSWTLTSYSIYYGVLPKSHLNRNIEIGSSRPFKIALENVDHISISAEIVLWASEKNVKKPTISVEKTSALSIECSEPCLCDIQICGGSGNHEIMQYTLKAKWDKPEPVKKAKLEAQTSFLDLNGIPDEMKVKKMYNYLVDCTLEKAIEVMGLNDQMKEIMAHGRFATLLHKLCLDRVNQKFCFVF